MINVAFVPFRTLLFITFLLCVSIVPAAAASEVPFTILGGQIIIRAKIKKDIDVEAAVITGSPYSYLNAELVSKLKLPVKYTNDGPVTGRNDRILLFSELSGVVVGNEKPVDLYIRSSTDGTTVVSLATLTKGIGRQIGIALGADFFENRIVQFDFQAKVIRFLDAPPFDYKNPPRAADGSIRSIHKMEARVDTFYGRSLTLPVVGDLMFDTAKGNAIFDTGIPQPVLLSPGIATQLSLPQPEKGKASAITLKSLKLGAVSFNEVPALVLGKDSPAFNSPIEYSAVIGLAVIQNLRITLDWKKNSIVIEN